MQISPCACNRTIHTTIPAPCPQDADSLLERVVREYGDSACSDLATLRGVDQKVGSSLTSVFSANHITFIQNSMPNLCRGTIIFSLLQVLSYSVFGEFPSDYHLGLHKLLPRIKEVINEYIVWEAKVYLIFIINNNNNSAVSIEHQLYNDETDILS